MSAIIAGCRSPLDSDPGELTLEQIVANAIDRELEGLPPDTGPLTTTRTPSTVEEELAERRDELEALGPATEAARTPFDLGPDLVGAVQETAGIDLDSAIASAVRHNLLVQIASLQPAINREDVIRAEAVFDFVLGSTVDFTKTDQPQAIPVINNIPLGTPFRASEEYRFDTSLRKPNRLGGELTASTDLTRFRNQSPGLDLSPDPAYTAAVRLGYTQPLLRGFGEDVNTASIQLADNSQQRAGYELTEELLRVVQETETAYWSLAFAWREVEIRQWLVDVGIEVRDVLDRRREFDTKLAQYSDAVAQVEERRANVIRARQRVREASDVLKRIMNDPELTISSVVVLEPADAFIDTPLTYQGRDLIITALDNRPEVQIALLDIDDATIARMVAENARLPFLDLAAQVAYIGLEDDAGSSYDNAFDADFVDYIVGLSFEYPLGNRAADAEFRQTRLRRSQSILAYQQVVRDVVLEVKTALREVVTTYELIQATRSSRVAQAENLRALLVEEETLAGLTPEFLNLKFQRQDSLALARFQEIQAVVDFNQALAALYRALGTGLTVHQITVEPADPDAPPLRHADDR